MTTRAAFGCEIVIAGRPKGVVKERPSFHALWLARTIAVGPKMQFALGAGGEAQHDHKLIPAFASWRSRFLSSMTMNAGRGRPAYRSPFGSTVRSSMISCPDLRARQIARPG